MAKILSLLLPVLLVQAVLAVTAQQQQTMKTGSAAAAGGQLNPCVTAPTAPECAKFTYPQASAAADIGSLCKGMHFMASCSVAKACNASGAGPDGDPRGPGAAAVSKNNPDICDPFQHVTTVCKLDAGMSRMSGCNNFNTMCVPGSKVPNCAATGLTVLPTSEKVNSQVRSICEEMTMDGCERCMPSWQEGKKWADCDLLDTYSYLCYQMPEMSQCTEWHAMCKTDPSLKFCYPSASGGGGDSGGGGSGSGGDSGGGSAPGPVMKMYFFNEMPFYLLFKNWTPRTTVDLLGAWIAIFCMGVFYEFLQMVYGKREAEFWAHRARLSAAAAAAASQRGMDEEVGGPLAEGVVADGSDGRGGAAAVYVSGGAGYSCCNTPPVQPVLSAPGKSCCGGAAGAGDLLSSHDNSSLTPRGSSSPSSSYGPRAGAALWKGGGRRGEVGAVEAYMQPDLVAMDVVRGIARFVLAGMAYLLMLAAMSFNVPIFFAVISGVAVGSMLFGRWRWSSNVNEGYSHCGCGSS